MKFVSVLLSFMAYATVAVSAEAPQECEGVFVQKHGFHNDLALLSFHSFIV